ncbi:MAG TPA: DUF2905 domain-containing protein [Anaerolineaceae bacterium]|nr:DUF2905 domain-containing protein [Anaerolineaceae bacterium]
MAGLEGIGRLLVLVGIGIAVIGGLLWLGSRLLGGQDLPGTIRIETSGITCLIPLLASIVISLVLTVVLNIILRLMNR